MNAVTLTNHKIWDELAKILEPIHINHLATQHLESCNYKIKGYWDSNNKFYEEIAFIHPICAELIGRSLGTNMIDNWLIDVESPFVVAKSQPDLQHSA